MTFFFYVLALKNILVALTRKIGNGSLFFFFTKKIPGQVGREVRVHNYILTFVPQFPAITYSIQFYKSNIRFTHLPNTDMLTAALKKS